MTDAPVPSPDTNPVKAWDIPTRLFHWLLVICLGGLYATGEFGGFDFTMPGSGRLVANMEVHTWFGYATLGLIAFRIVWGIAGASTARFSNFVKGPQAIWAYMKDFKNKRTKEPVGHNPLGGAAVVVMLLVILVQGMTGLFTEDESFFGVSGPFVDAVPSAVSEQAKFVHTRLIDVILILVGLHVAAILLHWVVLKDNLLKAMFTGRKDQSAEDDQTPMVPASIVTTLVALAAGAGLTAYLFSL